MKVLLAIRALQPAVAVRRVPAGSSATAITAYRTMVCSAINNRPTSRSFATDVSRDADSIIRKLQRSKDLTRKTKIVTSDVMPDTQVRDHLVHERHVKVVPGGLELTAPAVEDRDLFFPNFWLRDMCPCSKCKNPDTKQRSFNTFEVPSTIKVADAEVGQQGKVVRVLWSDGHESYWTWNFLATYHNGPKKRRLAYFDHSLPETNPSVPYSDVMSKEDNDNGVKEMLTKIRNWGYVFVDGTPYDDPEATKALLERIAFIRVTHYGGFYDFTPNLAMADTAYTNLALAAHTDTTYFSDPAGLQAFHLLSHQPAPDANPDDAVASGGKSLLVDGYRAAFVLKARNPKAFHILSTVGLQWQANGNEGISISPYKLFPVIELGDNGELHRIRWNNDDRGAVPFGQAFSPTEWYEAAREWDKIIRSKEAERWVQLEPGKTLIFDNWRVLHGRSAFSGIRRICGGYINRDDYISRWKNTMRRPRAPKPQLDQ